MQPSHKAEVDISLAKSPQTAPTLAPAQHFPVRPFAGADAAAPLACGAVALDTLAAKFATPLYVYDAGQITHRLSLFQQALAHRPHLVCYAVKANSALAILKLLAAQGAGFDIVSGGELDRVLAAAPEAAGRVVFSGAGKTAAEIDRALEANILAFNVESEAELNLLAARAAKRRRKARFALRVNPDVFAETHPYISTGLREHKFGIDIGQARRIYNQAGKWLIPYGVSVHIGSQIRTAEPFGAAMKRVARLVKELARDGIALKTVDAGGGLGGRFPSTRWCSITCIRAFSRAYSSRGTGCRAKLSWARCLMRRGLRWRKRCWSCSG